MFGDCLLPVPARNGHRPKPVAPASRSTAARTRPTVADQEDEPVRRVMATAQQASDAELMTTRRTHMPVSLVVAPDPGDTSDLELAHALVGGHSWAIAETWHRFAPAVIMMARRALGSEAEAEDLAQEIFYRVFAKRDTLRAPDRLRSFIFSFAIRLLKNELRRRKARAWLSFQRPETLVDLGGELTDMESRDLLRRFYGLLDRLAPRNRLVFALRHLESMTVEEVAAHMEILDLDREARAGARDDQAGVLDRSRPRTGRIPRREGVAAMTSAGREQGTSGARGPGRPGARERAAAHAGRAGRRPLRASFAHRRRTRRPAVGGRRSSAGPSSARWPRRRRSRPSSSCVPGAPMGPLHSPRSPTASRAAASSMADTCANPGGAASSCSSQRGRSSS